MLSSFKSRRELVKIYAKTPGFLGIFDHVEFTFGKYIIPDEFVLEDEKRFAYWLKRIVTNISLRMGEGYKVNSTFPKLKRKFSEGSYSYEGICSAREGFRTIEGEKITISIVEDELEVYKLIIESSCNELNEKIMNMICWQPTDIGEDEAEDEAKEAEEEETQVEDEEEYVIIPEQFDEDYVICC